MAAGLLDEPLPEKVVWAYAAGHVLNDASAACWFSYLLIYRESLVWWLYVQYMSPSKPKIPHPYTSHTPRPSIQTNHHTVEKIRHLTALHAGVVMFSGQVCDALATPVAGLLGDATPVRGWIEWMDAAIGPLHLLGFVC